MKKATLIYRVTAADGEQVTAEPVHGHLHNRAAEANGIVWGNLAFTATPALEVGTELTVTFGYMR